MKNLVTVLITVIIAVIAASPVVKAQTVNASNGVYLTEQDYKTHKLSYVLGAKDKMQPGEFLEGKNVNITYQGKNIKLSKSEIYGYRSNNHNFRFSEYKSYEIVDTAEFFMYAREKLVQHEKGPKLTKIYYFSKSSNSTIMLLTPENVAVAFPKNHKFRNMVEMAAKEDVALAAYDTQSSEFKIKELYSESLK